MSLYPGPFLKHIIKWTEEPRAVHRLLNLSKPDKRMGDVELAVRYLAFADPNVTYTGNLKKFIDEVCLDYNDRFSDEDFTPELGDRLDQMERAIDAAIAIFGKHVCRKWKDGSYDRLFNRAVFDVIVGSLASQEVRTWAADHGAEFESAYVELSTADQRFVNSVETTTKSIEATRYRFTTWYAKLGDVSGIRLNIPQIG